MKRYTVKSQNTPIYSTTHTPSTNSSGMQFEGKKMIQYRWVNEYLLGEWMNEQL